MTSQSETGRILVVDDEMHIRLFIQHVLLSKGHTCLEAASLEEARALLSEGDYQLVLLDVRLPDGTGLDLLREINRGPLDTAVVMVSIVDEPDVAREALDFGAYGYLNKPFQANELLIQVENALRRRALEKENRSQRKRLEAMVAERTDALAASENRYKLLIESMNEGLAIVDKQGIITFSNPKLLELLGRTAEEFVGRPVTDFIAPEDLDVFRGKISPGSEGRTDPYEITWLRTDGARIQTRVSPTSLTDDENRFWGSLAVITDITASKKAKERLFFQAKLLDNVSEAVLAVDTEGVVTYWGRGAETLFGCREGAVIGRDCSHLFGDFNGRSFTEMVKHAVQGGIWKEEFVPLIGDERSCWVDATLSAVSDETNSATGVICILRDVTTRKIALDELARRQEEVSEKAAALAEMNAALKVLLEQREKDKVDLEENILSNIRELISPCLEQLKLQTMEDRTKRLLGLLELNLENIISPFSNKISHDFSRLTTKEIKVAQMIKDGMTNKEIAALMGVSVKTVEYYRNAIRGKLDLKNKKINLKSFLKSLA